MVIKDYRQGIYSNYVERGNWKPFLYSNGFFKHMAKVNRSLFKQYLPEDKNAAIVDLGCGFGRFLWFLQHEGYYRACRVDRSEPMLALAKQKGTENLILADVFDYLPQHEGEFDFIHSADVIEHFKKPEVLEFLELIWKALKPGGRVIIQTANSSSLFGSHLADEFTQETHFGALGLGEVLVLSGFAEVVVKGREPVVVSLGSAVRWLVWKVVKVLLKFYLLAEGGISWRLWEEERVLEWRIYAVGRKPC